MRLDIQDWKPFQIGRLFVLQNGKGITQDEIAENPGDFIAVQSGEENNGVMGYINLQYCKRMGYTLSEKPCLTVARSGSAGFVSFQIHGCVVGDSAKILLLEDDVASTEVYVFLQSVLTANRIKYTYGRKVTEDKYLGDWIKLPVQHNTDGSPIIDVSCKWSDEGYIPDWQFMEDYIKSLHHNPLTTKNKAGQVPELKVTEWKEFPVTDIFTIIEPGKISNASDLDEGDDLPYLGAKKDNNGVMQMCANVPNKRSKGNCVIMICDGEGSVGFANYMESDFLGTVNLMLGYNDEHLNPYTGLFLATILSQERPKYSFGRKWKTHIPETFIKLPVDADGNPDWQFMEDYIKSLPYGDRLEG
ncbi:MAG: restriction endonuclease subunit S [Clostridia bacterium]|nr:restriction endonuclease subunit S [Clostridia bacterium]